MAAAAAAAVRVASVLREMSGDAEEVEPDDDSEEIMQGVTRSLEAEHLEAEASSLTPRRPSMWRASQRIRPRSQRMDEPEEVEPGDDTEESMREYVTRNLELERLAEHLEAEAASLASRDAPGATDNTENLFAKAFWFDMSALTPRCAQEHADALRHADAFLEDVTLIQDVLPALDEYCQYLSMRSWYYNQVQCELLLIMRYPGAPDFQDIVKLALRRILTEIVRFAVVHIAEHHCRDPAVKWMMHFFDALPTTQQRDFFFTKVDISAFPKTSERIACGINLEEFVLCPDARNGFPTLDDVKFVHGILGQSFRPEMHHFECAAKNGHVECLRYAIEHGARCDARELLQNPDVQNMEVIQYLRTLVANDGASDTEETEDALRNTLDTVTTAAERGHLREETFIQAANDLMMVDRERRQPRDDD